VLRKSCEGHSVLKDVEAEGSEMVMVAVDGLVRSNHERCSSKL
jgi:hypothetical protein